MAIVVEGSESVSYCGSTCFPLDVTVARHGQFLATSTIRPSDIMAPLTVTINQSCNDYPLAPFIWTIESIGALLMLAGIVIKETHH